ncbi:DUF192 domain-containing protein [Olsenella uli]|uniref:DUF192 domain-containing protein n=1 Tax=Olsenella uli TaxID=133926 RepID=UPI00195DF358|nr:DUF192 domain-containing protein [Olsenella uli]MBM6675724.1 DUF192 domain-containing protein [Olsenella uli]
MGFARLASDERPGLTLELRVLTTWAARLRGLLGTGPDADPVMLARCPSVHTFGMRYPIDVALVGERGEVLAVRRSVPPRELVSHPEACCAIERPAAAGEWLEEGEHLWVTAVAPETMGG